VDWLLVVSCQLLVKAINQKPLTINFYKDGLNNILTGIEPGENKTGRE
jgi:hypothetical protein